MDPIERTRDLPGDLQPGFLGPGDSVTGNVTFDVERQPLMLILGSYDPSYNPNLPAWVDQLSALPVEG
jgi:hypothetical protein